MSTKIKNTNKDFMDDVDEDPPTFCPAALGLFRVGSNPSSAKFQQQKKEQNQEEQEQELHKQVPENELPSFSPSTHLKPFHQELQIMKEVRPSQQIFYRKISNEEIDLKIEETNYLLQNASITSEEFTINFKTKQQPSEDPNAKRVKLLENIASGSGSIQKISIPFQHQSLSLPSNNYNKIQIAKEVSNRFIHIATLPHSFNWICYEFFYSFIDASIYNSMNYFENFLKINFPLLKSYENLRKFEWRKIRMLLGKPRRFSPKFLYEERYKIELLRHKIRYLQLNKDTGGDMDFFQNMPSEIPSSLPIGTRVLINLHKPRKGIFTGTITSINLSNNQNPYTIKFDRHDLGIQSVPDYDIISLDYHRNLPLNTFITASKDKNIRNAYIMKYRSRLQKTNSSIQQSQSNGITITDNDDTLTITATETTTATTSTTEPINSNVGSSDGGIDENELFFVEIIGQYPVELIQLIIETRKLLDKKNERVLKLKTLNDYFMANKCNRLSISEINNQNNSNDEINDEFYINYTQTVIELEDINYNLNINLEKLQKYSTGLAQQLNVLQLLEEIPLLEKCKQKAEQAIIRKLDNFPSLSLDSNLIDLIMKLTTLILTIGYMGSIETRHDAILAIDKCTTEILQQIHPDNVEIFQQLICNQIHALKLRFQSNCN